MHLAIISPFPPTITGVGQYGFHITRSLANSGFFKQINVLSSGSKASEFPDLRSTKIENAWQPNQANARQNILARVKQLDPDLVWFNVRMGMFGKSPWLNMNGLAAIMQLRSMGYPTVVTLHEMIESADLRGLNAPGGMLAPFGARLLTDMATQADIVCLTMRSHADLISSKRPDVDCVHIPLGAYHEPVLLDEPEKPELLLFNMLAPFKGVELLLEAFSSLKPEFPDLRLTIAGEEHPRFPGYPQALRRRFEGIKDVRWTGKVADEDVKHLFQRAQIVVLPYLASTGASSVLYQAATWGRAVTASNLGEIRTLARENNFQVEFFESGSVEGLQKALRILLSSPVLRRVQAENNFRAVQNSRLDLTCQRYIQAFNSALEKHRITKRIPVPNYAGTRPL